MPFDEAAAFRRYGSCLAADDLSLNCYSGIGGRKLVDLPIKMKNMSWELSSRDNFSDCAGFCVCVSEYRKFRSVFEADSFAGVIDPRSASIPHPRGFGNNARVLGVYLREKRLVSLEEARPEAVLICTGLK